MAVAPIKTNLCIGILPEKRGNDRAVILQHWNLDENQKIVLSRNASGPLSYLPSRGLAFRTSQFLHD
jgi:hypothetical protein